jgi:hypothetical protein
VSATGTQDRPGSPAAAPGATTRGRHPGLRHGVVLASCIVVPVTYAMGAASSLRVEGFPTWGVLVLVTTVAVAAGVLGVETSRPGIGGVAARLVGAAVVALGVRMTVPSPSQALVEIREGDAYLVSGTALVVFATLVLGFVVGHVVTTRTVAIARGRPNLEAARADDGQLVVTAWGTGLALAIVAGLTHRSAGAVGQVLFLAALTVGLVVLADLRRRIPAPGATRAPIVATPRAVQVTAIASLAGVVVLLTGLIVPLLPGALSEGLGRPSEWVADLDLDWEPERSRAVSPDGEREQLLDRGPVDVWRPLRLPDRGELVVPGWVQVVVGAAVGVGLLLLLRPDRWGRTLQRLWAALRGAAWEDDEEGFEALRPVEDDDADGGGRADRFRDVLERVRPRPRDPRQAIVHDYLRFDRVLSRQDRGRRADETPLEHAARVGIDVDAVDGRALAELAALVGIARYGRVAPTEVDVDRSRELAQALEHQLRSAGRGGSPQVRSPS